MPPKRINKDKITEYSAFIDELIKINKMPTQQVRPALNALLLRSVGKIKSMIQKLLLLNDNLIIKIIAEVSITKEDFIDQERKRLPDDIYDKHDDEYIEQYLENMWETGRPLIEDILKIEMKKIDAQNKKRKLAQQKDDENEYGLLDVYMYSKIMHSKEYIDNFMRIEIKKELQKRKIQAADPRVIQEMQEEMERRRGYEMQETEQMKIYKKVLENTIPKLDQSRYFEYLQRVDKDRREKRARELGVESEKVDIFDAAIKAATDVFINNPEALSNIKEQAVSTFQNVLFDEEETFLVQEEIDAFKKSLDEEFARKAEIAKKKGFKRRKLFENLTNEITALENLRETKLDDELELIRIDKLLVSLNKFRDDVKEKLSSQNLQSDDVEYKQFLLEREKAIENAKKIKVRDDSYEDFLKAPLDNTKKRTRINEYREFFEGLEPEEAGGIDLPVEDESGDVVEEDVNEDQYQVVVNEEGEEIEGGEGGEENMSVYEPAESKMIKRSVWVERFPHLKDYNPEYFRAKVGDKMVDLERVNLNEKVNRTVYTKQTGLIDCSIWKYNPWIKNFKKMWIRIISQSNENIKFILTDTDRNLAPKLSYKNIDWNVPSRNLYNLLCDEFTSIDVNGTDVYITNDDEQVVLNILYEVGPPNYGVLDLGDDKKNSFVEFDDKLFVTAQSYLKENRLTSRAKALELLKKPVDQTARETVKRLLINGFIDMIVQSNDRVDMYPMFMPDSNFYFLLEDAFYKKGGEKLATYLSLISTLLFYIGPISIQYPQFVNNVKNSKYTYYDLVDLSFRNSPIDYDIPSETEMLPEILASQTPDMKMILSLNEKLRKYSVNLQHYICFSVFTQNNPFINRITGYDRLPKPVDMNGDRYVPKEESVVIEPKEKVVIITTEGDESYKQSYTKEELLEEVDDIIRMLDDELDKIEYIEEDVPTPGIEIEEMFNSSSSTQPIPKKYVTVTEEESEKESESEEEKIIVKPKKKLFNSRNCANPKCKNKIDATDGYKTIVANKDCKTGEITSFCSLNCISETLPEKP